MLHRIRMEVSVAAAIVIAIAALVLAIRDDGSTPAAVVQEPVSEAAEAVAIDLAPKGAVEVDIIDFAYSPDPVRVHVGTLIAWTNQDRALHTVTARDGSWDSKIMAQGDTFTMTFDEPGVYVYICELHPPRHGIGLAPAGVKLVGGGGGGMQSTIIVE